MVSIGTLVACAPPSLRDLAQSATGAVEAATAVMKPAQAVSDDPLLAFLAEAEEGDVRDFSDADTGARIQVTAGRVYHAASGRVCRRFRATNVAALEWIEESLVCRDATGHWIRADILAPTTP